jgi:hypothetical protein
MPGPGGAEQPASAGGNYRVFWHSTDAGAGRSAAGTYVLLASIGQSDAGVAAAGAYRVRGGFLPVKGTPLDSIFINGLE